MDDRADFTDQDIEDAIRSGLDAVNAEIDAELAIAVVGKVSAGKSSFLNALFGFPRKDPHFPVGATSGTTGVPKVIELGKISILDTPGLQDVDTSKSDKTAAVLKKGVDLGILVLQGSVDRAQRENWKTTESRTKRQIVVITRADIESEANRVALGKQWRESLDIPPEVDLFWVSARGYDPKDRIVDPVTGDESDIPTDPQGVPLTIRGVEKIRAAIFRLCKDLNKELVFAREIRKKRQAAVLIIVTATVSASLASLVPGTLPLVAAAQASGIAGLAFVYTGRRVDKGTIARILMTVAAAQPLTSLFLFVKTFLPPTGAPEIAAVIAAASSTAALLIVITLLLEAGQALENILDAKSMIKDVRNALRTQIGHATVSEVTTRDFWFKLIEAMLERK